MKYISKEGQHGTLYLYRVHFNDYGHVDSVRYWAYDAEHARVRFEDSSCEDGFESAVITSVERVRAIEKPFAINT